MEILLALAGALLLYRLQMILYKRYWNRKLQVNMTLSKAYAVEGEDCILTETIINKKLLPIPVIKVKFMTSRYLSFHDMSNSDITDNYYRNDLLSVMMYQKITRDISFCCSHRGYYSIDKIFVVCSDLLLQKEYVNTFDQNLELTVYPRLVEEERLQIPFRKMLGTILTKRFINEDPFEFKSIREYQSYDTMKTINWKASAKSGSLMVNVFDYTASQQITILLDLKPEPISKWDELTEESIRIAATLAAKFIDQGIPTALYTNAHDILTKEPKHISAGSGVNHLRTINDALARVNITKDIPAFLPLLREKISSTDNNDYIVLISSNQKDDLQLTLTSLLADKKDFSWIVPYNNEMTLNINNVLLPHVTEWNLKAQ